MTTKQQRYRDRKVSEGYKQIVLLLSSTELAELDRKAAKAGSRLKAAQRWSKPRRSFNERVLTAPNKSIGYPLDQIRINGDER